MSYDFFLIDVYHQIDVIFNSEDYNIIAVCYMVESILIVWPNITWEVHIGVTSAIMEYDRYKTYITFQTHKRYFHIQTSQISRRVLIVGVLKTYDHVEIRLDHILIYVTTHKWYSSIW